VERVGKPTIRQRVVFDKLDLSIINIIKLNMFLE